MNEFETNIEGQPVPLSVIMHSCVSFNNSQPFYEGQEVVCINDNFPMVVTTNEDKSALGKKAKFHPQKNEPLVIDEILGPYLRFNKYDSEVLGYQWWHHTSFVGTAFFRLRKLQFKVADLVISDLCALLHDA